MAVAYSLIPGLDEIVKNGDPKRRADAARKISELFLGNAAQFRPAHVDLFDGILTGLVPHTEIAAPLGLPTGTVKGRMRLGLNKLREAFDEAAA